MIFERYHPIMTAHFELDWLTTFKVKDIFALRHDATLADLAGRDADRTIMETAGHVNRVMSTVMHNDALVWGIGDKQTGSFLGTFAFSAFNVDHSVANIVFEVMPSEQQTSVMAEVLSHMVSFAFDELALTRLMATVSVADLAAQKVLVGQGFTKREATAIDGGRSVEYTLARDQR